MNMKKNNYHFFEQKINQHITNYKSNVFDKYSLELIKQISQIKSQDAFDLFFSSYNTKSLTLSLARTLSPMRTSLISTHEYNINIMPFLFHNMDLYQIIKSKDPQILSDKIDSFNHEFSSIFSSILAITRLNDDILNRETLNKNILQTTLDLFYQKEVSSQFVADIAVSFLLKNHESTPEIMEILSIFEEEENETIIHFIEDRIPDYVYFNDIFEKMVKIADINIYQNKDIMEKTLSNPLLLEKYIRYFGFEKFDTLYSELIYDKNSADFDNRFATEQELRTTLTDELIREYKSSLDFISALHNTHTLDKILKENPDFISRYLNRFYESDTVHYDVKPVLDMLKAKYQVSYHFYTIDKNTGNTKFKDIKEKNNLLLEYVIKHNLSEISEYTFDHILKSAMNIQLNDIVDLIFENKSAFSPDQIYLKMIDFFGKDKRIKFYTQPEGLTYLQTLLSEDYRTSKKISLSEKEINNALNQKTLFESAGNAIISKFILERQIILENKKLNNNKRL